MNGGLLLYAGGVNKASALDNVTKTLPTGKVQVPGRKLSMLAASTKHLLSTTSRDATYRISPGTRSRAIYAGGAVRTFVRVGLDD